jgi:hypothetical protein
MNPFLAKLTAILWTPSFGETITPDSPEVMEKIRAAQKSGWFELNETVVVFGWNGNSFLIAREKGQIEVHPVLQTKLRLPNSTDILPPGLVQQMLRKVT